MSAPSNRGRFVPATLVVLSLLGLALPLVFGTTRADDRRDADGNAAPPASAALPASIRILDLPPRIAPPFAPSAPASRSAARVLETLGRVRAGVRSTRYQHNTVVRERDGLFAWDCSGMAAWVLRRSAPGAMRVITRGRPVARDFVRAIESAPIGRSRAGWQRLASVSEALPGDLFAWRRPRGFPSRNTGHVGFVVNAPVTVPSMPGAFAVRIADATSLGHQDDSRRDDPDGGFGVGTIVFLTDASGHGTHYGWFGTESEGYVVTPIVMGRVTR